MHSQLPGRPSFRNSAMHAVAVVPLTIPSKANKDGSTTDCRPATQTSHSEKSFQHLLSSLQEFAIQGCNSHQRTDPSTSTNNSAAAASRKWSDESSEITLVLPHSQLTRPGDWRYDSTPLKSHDWQSGCQRIRIFDGRSDYSRMASDRIGGSSSSGISTRSYQPAESSKQQQTKEQDYYNNDPWADLEPHRSTSAIIGILNMKDCTNTQDLYIAEDQLIQWARLYTQDESITLDKKGKKADSDSSSRSEKILIRLFVFDSFEEHLSKRCNLNSTRFGSNQLVAFPPLDMSSSSSHGGKGGRSSTLSQMMVLHWNVVVNDLAVALFRNVEKQIRENDLLGKSLVYNKQSGGGSGGNSSHASASGAGQGDEQSVRTDSSVTAATDDTSQVSGESSSNNNQAGGFGRFARNAFDNTRKAIANRQDSATSSGGSVGGGTPSTPSNNSSDNRRNNKLVTPLDLDATNDVISQISSRDLEALKRRDLGRREKRSADLSLLAGSPIDAYERYTRAAELTRHSHDPLWYASALEGCACAFVSMVVVVEEEDNASRNYDSSIILFAMIELVLSYNFPNTWNGEGSRRYTIWAKNKSAAR